MIKRQIWSVWIRPRFFIGVPRQRERKVEQYERIDPLLRDQDVRPLIVDLLCTNELYYTINEGENGPQEKSVDRLVQILFDHEPDSEDRKLLLEVLRRQGFECLVAIFVYGKDYFQKYGYGPPMQDVFSSNP